MYKHMCYPLVVLFTIFGTLNGQTSSPTLLENPSAQVIEKGFTLPSDITFLIADLKYNERQGVKICEIQAGSVSKFSGYDYLYGQEGLVAGMFCDFLSQYQNNFWYFSNGPCDSKFKEKFDARGWTRVNSNDDLKNDKTFKKLSTSTPKDSHSLHDHKGILYGRQRNIELGSVKRFVQANPGIILLDASIYPYQNDKFAISTFLSKNETSSRLKPRWNVYPKKYSSKIANTIIQDINSDVFVIKPLSSTRGQGVIIVSKNDLDDTLRYIFTEDRLTLRASSDLSFSYWGDDHSKEFLVEEFVGSDPVQVPQFDNQLYDGTMRVVFFLTYDKGIIDIHFIEGHWKIPKKSISAEGTLSEKHKSFGEVPHFLEVNPQTLQKVQDQLREQLPYLYKQLLGI